MTGLLILEDRVLRAMLTDQRVLQAIPCLSNVAKEQARNKVSCGRCEKKKQAMAGNAVAAAKQCIGNLAPQAKLTLKQLVNAQSIRLTYRTANGRLSELTF